MADNQDLVRGLKRAGDGIQVGLAVMLMSGSHGSSFMVDISASILRNNVLFSRAACG